MNICGRSLGDHVRLVVPLFGLIAVVWAIRWILDAAGAPHGLVRVFSVTGAIPLAILIAVWLIHKRGFGSYPNVLVAAFLLVVAGQMLIIIGILFSLFTGIENVFTHPEVSAPDDPHHIRHILGQLTFGIGAGTLLGAGTGCLMLWLIRKLVPPRVHA